MLTNSSWQLLFGLFVMGASCFPEWNVETQSGEIAFADPVPLPESGTTNTAASLAPATPDASSEFAQIPDGGNNEVSSDELVAQASSNGCRSNTKRLSRKMRARDDLMCPIDGFQLNNGEDNSVRQLSPTLPNAPQGGGSGQNSGGNGEPQRRLLFAPKDDTNSYFFLPNRNRPNQNSEICPEPMHSVPVCGRPSDAYDMIYADNSGLTIDPCYPYVPLASCVANTIGYCCFTTDVAYATDDLTRSEKDLWNNLLNSGNRLKSIEQGLTAGLRNPYKLVGLSCIPMAKTASEQGQGQGQEQGQGTRPPPF